MDFPISVVLRQSRMIQNSRRKLDAHLGAALSLRHSAHHPAAREALLAVLADQAAHPELRAACICSLSSQLGWIKVDQAIRSALGSPDWQVREAALHALAGRLTSGSFKLVTLMAMSDPAYQVRRAAVRALAPDADLGFVLDVFVFASQDENEEVRAEGALAMLAWLGKRRGLAQPLQELLRRRRGLADPSLRRHIREVLRRLDGEARTSP